MTVSIAPSRRWLVTFADLLTLLLTFFAVVSPLKQLSFSSDQGNKHGQTSNTASHQNTINNAPPLESGTRSALLDNSRNLSGKLLTPIEEVDLLGKEATTASLLEAVATLRERLGEEERIVVEFWQRQSNVYPVESMANELAATNLGFTKLMVGMEDSLDVVRDRIRVFRVRDG